jgi:diadenosine tetraphosphatase ApaH/serine/threonine PP2A family protein phosphatase
VLRYAHGLETWRREPSTPSEHETLASRLSISDLEWFQTLPLSVHLQEHDVLVVHAGVPPGQAPDKADPNLLMNIRNLTPSGEATSKSGVGSAWAQSWGGQPDIVFGHDAQRGYTVYDHAVGLDSGCVYGGSLTALLLPDRAVVAVPAVELHCDPHSRT